MLNRFKSRSMAEVSDDIRKAGAERAIPKPLEEDQKDATTDDKIEDDEPHYDEPQKRSPEEMNQNPNDILDPEGNVDNEIEDKQKAIDQASPGESAGMPVG